MGHTNSSIVAHVTGELGMPGLMASLRVQGDRVLLATEAGHVQCVMTTVWRRVLLHVCDARSSGPADIQWLSGALNVVLQKTLPCSCVNPAIQTQLLDRQASEALGIG